MMPSEILKSQSSRKWWVIRRLKQSLCCGRVYSAWQITLHQLDKAGLHCSMHVQCMCASKLNSVGAHFSSWVNMLQLWCVQAIGDTDLAARFAESVATIRRDIMFAASLYI